MQRESEITELCVKAARSESARAAMWPSVRSWGCCMSAGKLMLFCKHGAVRSRAGRWEHVVCTPLLGLSQDRLTSVDGSG